MHTTGEARVKGSGGALRWGLLGLFLLALASAGAAAPDPAAAGAERACEVQFEDRAEPGIATLLVRCEGLATVDGWASETIQVEPIGNSGCDPSFMPTTKFRCDEERSRAGAGRDFIDTRIRAQDNDPCRDPRLALRLRVNFDDGSSRNLGTFRPTGCPGGSGGGSGEPGGGSGGGECTIQGTTRNDILRGTPRDDVICGGGGNDIVYGLGGDDELRGGGGNDVLRGGDGDDRLGGGGGDDAVIGEGGRDELEGGEGSDTLSGQAGSDSLDSRDGERGNDVANGGSGADTCRTDPGDARSSC